MTINITSAGGILLRREGNRILIAIVERTKGVEEKWAPVLRQLPKGGCLRGESLEQTALREVLEETGFRARILGKAGEASWSYERSGQLWNETIHYYHMVPIKGTFQHHDDEFDIVRWVEIEEAAHILSYPEERDIIAEIITSGESLLRRDREADLH